MSPQCRVKRLFSAGGVVYRTTDRGTEVVLCGRNSPRVWALPKGTPRPGEDREQTALREVQEETGLLVESAGLIDSIEYWFVRPSDGARCHKTVHFFCMRPTGGDTSRHDHEFDAVRWYTAGEALRKLTYGNEIEIVKKGLPMDSEQGRTA